ncbi:programmed cell death protein 2 [Episyrphus balteatus]|uniref:programmed cell death protein 2 n=1 Tax=Episyrphus balteatus TaxID=286459 RepID=UPI002486BF97|nr:programmed cell death protein 2 [Episyrphus balteatus]
MCSNASHEHEHQIDLGFAEECEPNLLRNVYFPSKIGGKPAWLDLEKIPSTDDLKCKKCGAPQSFLCQIYAPIEEKPECFHRTIYIFICREPSCSAPNSAENFSAFRSQLPRQNQFYSAIPPNEDEELPAVEPSCRICSVCGCRGNSVCSRCKGINYCSAKHQRAHWPQHKVPCRSGDTIPTENINIPTVSFPEFEVVIEADTSIADQCDHCTDDEATEQSRLDEFQKLADEGKTGTMDEIPESELSKYATEDDENADISFRHFKEQVAKNPSQILRYDIGGEPLWIADTAKTIGTNIQIPPCPNCSAARHFEFQIMPQMLNYLKDDVIDWGVLAVYSCKNSCQPSTEYVREFIIKQDIISEENK